MAINYGYNYSDNLKPGMNTGPFLNFGVNGYQPPPGVVPALTNTGVSTMGSGIASFTPPVGGIGNDYDPYQDQSIQPETPEGAPTPFSIGGLLKNTLLNDKGGLNIGGITSLLGSIGGIYGAIKGFGLAKDQLDFQKTAFNTNLDNSKKSYNTALEGDAHSRAAAEGRGKGWVDDYVNKNKL